MEKVSIEDISIKLNTLSYSARKEVYDFMNFLLTRQRKKKKPDKGKLLNVSIWKDSDIKAIENIGRELNKWAIPKF